MLLVYIASLCKIDFKSAYIRHTVFYWYLDRYSTKINLIPRVSMHIALQSIVLNWRDVSASKVFRTQSWIFALRLAENVKSRQDMQLYTQCRLSKNWWLLINLPPNWTRALTHPSPHPTLTQTQSQLTKINSHKNF